MASDLKRVGLAMGIEGDKEFKNSLKEINAQVKESASAFKLTQAQYDKNTSSVDKLKNAQKNAQVQVENYTKKVDVLEKQLAVMENSENRNEEAIAKKKDEINRAKTSLTNYENIVKDTTKSLQSGSAQLKDYSEKVGEVSSKVKGFGDSMTKNVTVPIMALATASEVAWKVIDDAYDNIIKMTGATGVAAQELTDAFDNVYGSMPSDSKDVSNAIGEINTLWGLQGQELEDTSKYYLKFAEITNTDVKDAIDSAYQIQQQWNLSQEETDNLMGMIASGTQATGKEVSDYTSFIGENAATLQEMNLSSEEAVNFFNQMSLAGVDGSAALMGLKKAATNYAEEGKSMTEGLGDLSARLQDASTHDEAFAEVVDLVGTRNGLAFSKMLQDGTLSLDGLEDKLGNYADVVETTFDETQDPADKVTSAFHDMQLTMADLGATIQEVLAPVIEVVASKLKEFSEWFKNLNPEVKNTIVIIGGIVAAIGPLISLIGIIGGMISTGLGVLSSLAGVLAGVGGAVATISAPVIAIIAVIGLVIAALIKLWNTNKTFRASVESMFKALGDIVQNFVDNFIMPVWETIKTILLGIWENGLKPLWDKFVDMIGNIVIAVSNFMVQLQPIIDFLVDVFGVVIPPILSAFGAVFSAVFDAVCNVMGVVFDTISSSIEAIIQVFSGIINFIQGVFSGNWQQAWDGIVQAFSGIFNGIIGIAKAPINMVIGLINGMISGIETGVNACINAINTLSFDVPDWVPVIGGQHWGFSFGNVGLGRIPELAKGGQLYDGMAVVAEAGPELLMQNGNSSTVVPLSDSSTTHTNIIDYDKLANAVAIALEQVQVKVDKRVFGQLVSEVK